MDPDKKKLKREQPEKKIERAIMTMLKDRDWFVMKMHGNAFQKGVPDLYACHYRYGARWIEVKLPHMIGSQFTTHQLEVFPRMEAAGAKVWILTGANEHEYDKLKGPSNFHEILLRKL